MSGALFEIVPIDDGWVVRMPGDSVFEFRPSKSAAIQRARQLGQSYGTWRIRVLSSSGEVDTELASPETPPAS